jgi:hypothetical protein
MKYVALPFLEPVTEYTERITPLEDGVVFKGAET